MGGESWPHGDDERRKSARFQGHDAPLDPVPGIVPAFDPDRAAVCRWLHRLHDRRPQDPGQGHHQALRRRDGHDRRHRNGHRFRLHRPDHFDHPGAVPGLLHLQLYPGLDHVQYLDGHHLPLPPGHRRQDQPPAVQILRWHQPRRSALAHHQRCRYRQPDPQPEPVADHHLGDHGDRRADHDAHHQLADDPGGPADRAALDGR